MFNFHFYPYSSFNEVNLNWIMTKLPIDISENVVPSGYVDVRTFKAVKIGPVIEIYLHGAATHLIAAGTPIMSLPENAAINQYLTMSGNQTRQVYTSPGSPDIVAQTDIAEGQQFWGVLTVFVEEDESYV